ncbi:hypothetical protein AAC387_Pa06g1680 [Persea americana]
MEVLGIPTCEVWIIFKGVPQHVWRERTFSLAEYVGSIVGVDPLTPNKEMLIYGRVKVSKDANQKLPQRIYLWLDDLCAPIDVEMEEMSKEKHDKGKVEDFQSEEERCSFSSCSETGEEDNDVTSEFSNSNLPLPKQNSNFGALDLDLLPRDRLTVVDNGPEVRLGPHMDHGLENGVGPLPLVEY